MDEMIETKKLVEDLVDAGLTRATAKRSVRATLAVLGERLTSDEARWLASRFVGEGKLLLEEARHDPNIDANELFARVQRRLTRGVSLAIARERAEVVLASLGRRASPEIRARLERALPPDLAALLRPRELGEPPPPRLGRGRTLATGAPPTQRHSVVREENPHGDSKLSSAHPGYATPISEARPGFENPISEAKR